MNIIAHRGVSAHFHENTLLAFEKALELGVFAIEVDLHQVEHQFVIFHDFELDRLANIRAELADLSLEEVANIRLQNKHKLPLLSELFEIVQGKSILNLELKYIIDPRVLVEQITQYIYQYNGDVIISSFDHPLLVQMQGLLRNTRIQHKVKIGALIAHLPLDNAQYAINMQADIAAIDAALVNKDFVDHAHQYNVEVWCYTVNYEKAFRHLLNIGVDAVFSNDPELMASYLLE